MKGTGLSRSTIYLRMSKGDFPQSISLGDCSGQLKLATVLEFSQYSRSDSLGVRPPLY
nr:AlpA family phage regulatory protein [Vibrio natriegens]